jgi:hypothetical protein
MSGRRSRSLSQHRFQSLGHLRACALVLVLEVGSSRDSRRSSRETDQLFTGSVLRFRSPLVSRLFLAMTAKNASP